MVPVFVSQLAMVWRGLIVEYGFESLEVLMEEEVSWGRSCSARLALHRMLSSVRAHNLEPRIAELMAAVEDVLCVEPGDVFGPRLGYVPQGSVLRACGDPMHHRVACVDTRPVTKVTVGDPMFDFGDSESEVD